MIVSKPTRAPFSLCLSLLVLCVSPAVGEIIHYDASVLPNDPSIAGTFSYFKSPDASWSTDGSILTLTPENSLSDVWFGWSDFPTHGGTPNWTFAPNDLGNKVTLTCKVSPGSEYFTVGFDDGSHQASMNIKDGSVRLTSPSGTLTSVPLDTTVFHTYSILSVNNTTTYFVDGTSYAGGSTALANPYLYIGDFGGNPGGSMYVGDVTIFTEVPEPSTIALFSLLALIGGAVAWRKGRGCNR